MASDTPIRSGKLEPPGIDTRAVLLTGAAALVLLAGAVGGFTALYRWQVPFRPLPPPAQFPAPQVRPGEADELSRLLSEQRRRLGGYSWVDRQHGLVQIPIERAMQLIVQAGARAYDPINSSVSVPDSEGAKP